MTKTSLTRLLSLLAALAMIAGACGSDSAGTEAGSDGESTETTEAMEEESTETTEAMEEESTETTEAAEEEAAATVEAAPSCVGESDGVLTIGGLLPQTGNLAFLGPPEEAAAALAIQDINEAGGVLGTDAVFLPGDSGDNGDVANQTVDRALSEGADAMLGAASSGVSKTVIDKITGACKIQFSPANTASDFTDYADDDLYFRTAPTDILQGTVLADLILEEGSTTVALMALQDPYGEGLLNFTKGPLTDAGAEVVAEVVYDPKAQSFDAEVQQVVTSAPEAVVVIGFDESASILTGLFEAGLTPDTTKIYLVDGNVGNGLGEKFTEPGVLAGIKGTLPAAELTDAFRDRLLEVDPGLIDFSYGPETYDAVVIIALATELAGTDDPAQIAARINGVTRDGEKCTSFAECKDLIAAGTDIDYDGPSGPQAFGPAGEPTEASYAILSYASDSNTIDNDATIYKFAAVEG